MDQKTIREKTAKDIENCEKIIGQFPSENRFAQGISRSIKKIQNILSTSEEKDESSLRHDLRNSLAAALGYVDLLKIKTEKKEEKAQAENLFNCLKSILETTSIK